MAPSVQSQPLFSNTPTITTFWSVNSYERLFLLSCLRESGASSVGPPRTRLEMISVSRLQVAHQLCTLSSHIARFSIITNNGLIQTASSSPLPLTFSAPVLLRADPDTDTRLLLLVHSQSSDLSQTG